MMRKEQRDRGIAAARHTICQGGGRAAGGGKGIKEALTDRDMPFTWKEERTDWGVVSC